MAGRKPMKIGIYNLEPKYINIALEKIRMYHCQQGDRVENYLPGLFHNSYDRIYCSSIFDFTKKPDNRRDMIVGGSGFNLYTILPKEIENMKPKLNIGFTTRGCNRKCSFCIVWRKENKFKIVGTFYDFWDRISKIVIYFDNNILFDKKHFINECKNLIKEKLKVSFSQGLDLRLIDINICKWLAKIKHYKKIKFAFDNYEEKELIINKLKLVKKFIKASKIMVYILCGYNTSFQQDMERVKILKSLEVDPFVMLYHKKLKLLNEFARWNNRFYFRNIDFKQYLKSRNYTELWQEENQ